ncbi:MAG: Nramp family divalent metal transporter [Actinobacteria bacterium]|nr:Nramp family divalent metal transporter [Actinomycetota bacterium]
MAVTEKGDKYDLGVGRPPLDVLDLPEPEEVFGVRHIGFKETIKFAVGPSLIALGVSIGSGEWLLGPLAIGGGGTFRGLGIVILISILFQTFYNREIARYVTATGEVPIVGFARVPPGAMFWVPVSLFLFYAAFLIGGWAASAGQGLYALITGEAAASTEEPVRLLAMALIVLILGLTMAAKKISRTLELANWVMVVFVLSFLLVVDLFVVPMSKWVEGITGLITPALPPKGTDATVLGGLFGFAAMSTGLNWYMMGHYRDKGYGMGHRVGYLAGMRGESKEVRQVGVTFPNDEKNAALWKRWARFLSIDMWGVFFVGALLGILLPTLLVSHLADLTGTVPTEANIPTYAASALQQTHGQLFFYLALIIGVMIMFSTQLGIFEALVRNFVDAAMATSPKLRARLQGDERRFYFPYMVFLAIVISIMIHLALPGTLILFSANLSNLGGMIFPFVLMYLNGKLPEAARPPGYTNVILVLFALACSFFFINFVADTFFGGPVVQF